MRSIQTATDLFGPANADEYHAWLMGRKSTIRRAQDIGVSITSVGRPDDIDGAAPPAFAYVNHGRWVADCPTNSCGGALVLLAAAQGFLCVNCLNIEVANRYRPVIWPEDSDVIAAALEARLLPEQANWHGEPVESLIAENIAHGIVVPS